MIPAQTHTVPKVYVSLGFTNYPVNNSHILITALGQNNDQALVCHTESIECCRGVDNPYNHKGKGEWLFPNGTAVQRSLDVQDSSVTNVFHRSHDFRLIRLHREGDIVNPTGTYCCEIPSNSSETVTFCVVLGTQRLNLSIYALYVICHRHTL